MSYLHVIFCPEVWSGSNDLLLFSACVLVIQSCPTLCDPMDYSPSGFSVYGMLQARILD